MNTRYLVCVAMIAVKRCVPCALRWAASVRAARKRID